MTPRGQRDNSVTFINRVYPPDTAATGQLLAELAGALRVEGWRVTIVTARTSPNTARFETMDGIQVHRVRGVPFTRTSHVRRALGYLSLYPAMLWRAWRIAPADVIVTMTDPPLVLLLALALRWRGDSAIVHWAQDIYPELAEELGVLSRGGTVARILRSLSTWALKRYDRVIVLGACMRERLIARGISEELIEIVPNWADAERIYPVAPAQNSFRKEYHLDHRFVVMYSGNFGLAHPFAAILEAAQSLATERPEIVFLLVGEGPRLWWIRDRIHELNLENVSILPPQPKSRLAESLGAADLHLACMDNRLVGLLVPSKVYGIMAAGRPCLFLGPTESEVARAILSNGCGEVVTTSTGDGLADRIRSWQADRHRRDAAGRAARVAALAWSRKQAAASFSNLLDTVCAGQQGRCH